jgi:hypothetical protein
MIEGQIPMYPKYENDFYHWAMTNAALLKQKKFDEVDMENIIEEIEAMGRSEKNQMVNRLSILIAHLLKWQFQPDFRGRSWHGTIKEQRKRIKLLLRENPSLKSKLNEMLTDAYDFSIDQIEKETPIDLKILPQNCPYSFDQCFDDNFYPNAI